MVSPTPHKVCLKDSRGGKNSQTTKSKKHILMHIATYNARSLLSEERLTEMESEMSNIKWDIIGVSEVRRKGESLKTRSTEHLFYSMENLVQINSFFYKKPHRRWTWARADNKTKNEIDFIVTNKKEIIQDGTVLNAFNTGSDHRMVRAEVKISTKQERRKLVNTKPLPIWTQPRDIKEYQSDIETTLRNSTDITLNKNIDALNQHITQVIEKSMRKHCPRNKNEEKLSTDTRNLMKQKNLITERNDPYGEQKKKINREVKKAIRKDLRKVITTRLDKKLNLYQSREQAGFKVNFGTNDHLQTIKQLIEKSIEYNKPLVLPFVDFHKAFDSVELDSVIEVLNESRIDSRYSRLICNIYKNATSSIQLHAHINQIKIQRGISQGDTLSPKLFISASEKPIKTLEWGDKRINVDGEMLHHLSYADDVVLISDDLGQIKKMLEELTEAIAILKALEYVHHEEDQNAIIFSDSLSVLKILKSNSNTTNDNIFSIQAILKHLQGQNKYIKFFSVKAHAGITNNEIADQIAKESIVMVEQLNYELTIDEQIIIA
ncbi:uncharacterized protein [Diabrotica undecimpunctata]|uniref:uncharacterized protein n=1 Tax=Diabrotica undecimpunctata TaxID=50387 RepID=UPI003B637310